VLAPSVQLTGNAGISSCSYWIVLVCDQTWEL